MKKNIKKQIKRWSLRILALGFILIGMTVTVLLSPTMLYANKTVTGNYTVYHNKPLPASFQLRLDQSAQIIKSSELYNATLKMDVCMKDGSKYPALVTTILGKDFLTSFYNKIIFTGHTNNFDSNYIELDGHKWNLTQMMAHAQVHCLQFKKYGLWKSNPIAKHPEWKWEGYPEYIARGKQDLRSSIAILLQAEQNNQFWITLPDGTEVLTHFYKYRLLIQFCLEEKRMSYVQLMKDNTPEEKIREEMMGWYKGQQ
jgi:hypothetical protein